MTTQIEVKGNKHFDEVNRNNVNRSDVNRRTTVIILNPNNNNNRNVCSALSMFMLLVAFKSMEIIPTCPNNKRQLQIDSINTIQTNALKRTYEYTAGLL